MRYLLALALLLACDSKKKDPPAPPPDPAAAPSEIPRELAAWMPADVIGAWQGAYLTSFPPDITKVVVDIRGEGAKLFDGVAESPLGFSVIAPCMVGFERPIGAQLITRTKQFVIEQGVVLSGDTAVGRRRGTAAIVCSDGPVPVFTFDDEHGCRAWTNAAGWRSKPATCGWKSGSSSQFTIGGGATERILTAGQDNLMDDAFADQQRRGFESHVSDYEAAKQTLTRTR